MSKPIGLLFYNHFFISWLPDPAYPGCLSQITSHLQMRKLRPQTSRLPSQGMWREPVFEPGLGCCPGAVLT